MSSNEPKLVRHVRIVERDPTWREQPYTLSYLLLDAEPTPPELLAIYKWADRMQLQNPRAISPAMLRWSSLFNPRFFKAVTKDMALTKEEDHGKSTLVWTRAEPELEQLDLTRFWLQSVMFLAGVTLSAAIVQSRHSSGTIGSKYDRLWEAGVLAEKGAAPELHALELKHAVKSLASNTSIADVERLLMIRRLFMLVLEQLAPGNGSMEIMRPEKMTSDVAEKFGFVDMLRTECGSSLHALIAYGSSVSSSSFADYDVLVIVESPELVLRQLAGKSPMWKGKELNVGIYSPEELMIIQFLSGDNLANYGLCLWGEAPVVKKRFAPLIARNFSFGTVRQRQQLGMINRAVSPLVTPGDDRRSLFDYFVKIPANVAKGTFGAMGQRLAKENILEWMHNEVHFDATYEQQRVSYDPQSAITASMLATGRVMEALNAKLQLVDSVDCSPTSTEVAR